MERLNGRKASPMPSGSYPRTRWKKRLPRKNIPNRAAKISNSTMFAPDTLRDRKLLTGTSGFAVRDSRTTKAISDAIAAAPNPTVWADPHPKSVVRMIVYTPSNSAAVTRKVPIASAPFPSPIPRSDSSNRKAKNAVVMPIGMLTRKIQCQLSASVRKPPARSPIDAPAAATKL